MLQIRWPRAMSWHMKFCPKCHLMHVEPVCTDKPTTRVSPKKATAKKEAPTMADSKVTGRGRS